MQAVIAPEQGEKRSLARVFYCDVLRVLATFFVMVLHAAGQNWAVAQVHSGQWLAFHCWDAASRWCVPVFVMLSGALFLGRPVPPLKRLYTKNILRLATAYAFWSLFYAALQNQDGSLKTLLLDALWGKYHLWFLYMMAGLYLALPLLHRLAENKRLANYFLLLALAFAVVLPQATRLLQASGGGLAPGLGDALQAISGMLQFPIAVGYSGYFLLGGALSQRAFAPRQRAGIYALGLLGLAATLLLTWQASMAQNRPVDIFYDYFTLNVLAMSAAVFVLVRYGAGRLQPGVRLAKAMALLSDYSFGAYLVHAGVLDGLAGLFGLDSMGFTGWLSVPVLAALVFAASFAISALLHRIPVVKRYLV